jgi:hypothetical protein
VDYLPLNPILLRNAIKRLPKGSEFSFMRLEEVVKEELERLRSAAVLGWENKSVTLFGETIQLPLLNLDYRTISDFRDGAMG